jgi:ech hydrogenase subunit A
LLFVKNDSLRKIIVRLAALILIAVSLLTTVRYFNDGLTLALHREWINYGMVVIESILAIVIIALSIKHKKHLPILLILIQTSLINWYEFTHSHEVEIKADIVIDRFTLIMVLITGVIGSLICVYALNYMKDYHHHHQEVKDRRPFFFFLLFAFLSAMFGIVLSNNLLWMYFFWEITTLCSFLLIGYTQEETAVKNAFKALIMNLLGGFGFAAGIIYLGYAVGTQELNQLPVLAQSGIDLLIPAVLLAIAGVSKSAQMPFSSWLLGAMVAPTPSSALLHSSTMVKAGVYLLIRIAPILGFNVAGILVMMVGGITFLLASLMAITQSDGKKVLAYSTISNLGLIVACAGIGSYESIWAGMLLIIFHAIAKSLMFLSVGTVEHNMGSRDIEDMHGLIIKLPEMALMMTIGIAGMFLAPFGMLVSKWAALKAFIDSDNILIVMILVFGSAATLFYWTKWLGKLVAVLNKIERIPSKLTFDEWIALGTHAVLTVVICFAFPLIGNQFIEPYLNAQFAVQMDAVISDGNIKIMSMMLGMILLIPLGLLGFVALKEDRIVTSYMGGVNQGDNRYFTDALGNRKKMYLSNWYMEKYFSETRLNTIGIITTSAVIVVIFFMALGGVL